MDEMTRALDSASTLRLPHAFRTLARISGLTLLSGALAIAGPAQKALASASEEAQQSSNVLPRTIVRSSAPPRGTGLIIGGSAVVTLIGLPSMGLGLLMNSAFRTQNKRKDDFPRDEEMDEIERDIDRSIRGTVAYFVISGIIGIAGGATMIGFGVRRYSRFRDWKALNKGFLTRHQVRPIFSTTNRSTGTYGFAARF